MEFGVSLIIMLVSFIALVAEAILFGLATVGTNTSMVMITSRVIMSLTFVIGISAPICALIGKIFKRKNLSIYLMVGVIIFTLFVSINSFNKNFQSELPSQSNSIVEQQTTQTSAAQTEQSQEDLMKKEKSAYIKKVVLRNIEVAKDIFDEDGVFGEVKNTGDKSLDEVEITIYYLDKNGNPIYEEKYYPVLVSDLSIGNADKPLKPNYSRKFGYSTRDVPSDWARKVIIKVTDIKFTSK